jgi:Mlc titration factor MtfA (ptsG expression regulator)
MENNQQDISVDALISIAKNFGITVDDVIYFGEKNSVPKEISIEDKKALEQLQLINELDKEEKSILLKLIETFVSKKRFKDYLQKNIAAL